MLMTGREMCLNPVLSKLEVGGFTLCSFDYTPSALTEVHGKNLPDFSENRDNLCKSLEKVFWAPWALWVGGELGVPLPGPGLAACAPGWPRGSAMGLQSRAGCAQPAGSFPLSSAPTLLDVTSANQRKSKQTPKISKSQQFLDRSSAFSSHQAVPIHPCCKKITSFYTITRRNQHCCCLPLQTHPDITLMNQLGNQSCAI